MALICMNNLSGPEWEKLRDGNSDGNSVVIPKKFVHGYPSEFIGRILQASFDILKDVKPENITMDDLFIYLSQGNVVINN
jgi:hypothetical protein